MDQYDFADPADVQFGDIAPLPYEVQEAINNAYPDPFKRPYPDLWRPEQ